MSKMVTMRVPEDVLATINAEAASRGISRTALLLAPYIQRIDEPRERIHKPEAQVPVPVLAHIAEHSDIQDEAHRQVHNRAKATHTKCPICGEKA